VVLLFFNRNLDILIVVYGLIVGGHAEQEEFMLKWDCPEDWKSTYLHCKHCDPED
jgi:hypothetical protein